MQVTTYRQWEDEHLCPEWCNTQCLRDGTTDMFSFLRKETDAKIARLLGIVLSFMTITTIFDQLISAFRWGFKLPILSLIIVVKELFGALLYGPLLVSALRKCPKRDYYNKLFEPVQFCGELRDLFSTPSLRLMVRSALFIFGNLSNITGLMIMIVSIRWNIESPGLGIGTLISKIGNFAVSACTLAATIKHSKQDITSMSLFPIFKDMFIIVGAYIPQFTKIIRAHDWINDIRDSKLDSRGIVLGVDYTYAVITGCHADDEFAQTMLESATKAVAKLSRATPCKGSICHRCSGKGCAECDGTKRKVLTYVRAEC